MKPLKFKEATIELKKPFSKKGKSRNLNIYQAYGNINITLWSTPFWERLKFLFHGKLWLGVYSVKTHPPVWLRMTKNIF